MRKKKKERNDRRNRIWAAYSDVQRAGYTGNIVRVNKVKASSLRNSDSSQNRESGPHPVASETKRFLCHRFLPPAEEYVHDNVTYFKRMITSA